MATKLCLSLLAFSAFACARDSEEFVSLYRGPSSRDDVGSKLMGKSQTNWGSWSKWTFCPEDQYAVGAQLRVEAHQGSGIFGGDDTGLNAVRLMCAPLGEFNKRSSTAEPHPGLWGKWEDEIYCSNSLVTGFDLKSESNQQGGDDTAANNLWLYCSNSGDIEMNGHDWGTWQGEQKCPKGQAVCGIQVQVEENQGNGDDTALNNVNMACCKIHLKPEDTCDKASDQWDTILECGSKDSSAGMRCDYSKTVGITSSKTTSSSESKRVEKSVQTSIEVGIDFPEVMSTKFGVTVGRSDTTGYDWSKSQTEGFSSATTVTASYDVKPYKRVRMQQVVGKCGNVEIRTPTFRVVDV